jgi:hypothetical protein
VVMGKEVVVWIWWFWGVWEERNGEGGEVGCTALLKNGGRGMNNDLKIGRVRFQLECVRTHVSAFDRTRA